MFAPCFFFVTRETLLVASRSKWSANTVVVASRPGPASTNLSEWSGCSICSFFCWYIIEGFLYNKMDACERVVGMLLQFLYLVFGLQYRRQPKLPNLLASTRLVQGVIGFPSIVEILVGN